MAAGKLFCLDGLLRGDNASCWGVWFAYCKCDGACEAGEYPLCKLLALGGSCREIGCGERLYSY